MTLIKKALAAGALSAVLLSLASAATPAGRLLVRNSSGTRTWSISWSGVTFRSNGIVPISTACPPITLSGSLHSGTITKTAGSLIGYVVNASGSGTCTESWRGRVLTEGLPWHVRYQSFTGTLPNISSIGIRIVGFEYRLTEPVGAECLVRSTEAQPLAMTWTRAASGAVSGSALSGTITANCGLAFEVTSSGAGAPTPSTSITLI
ncbi:MAG TPA: hypothetical protein VF250_00685 [Conexibacter sp.]